MIKLYKGCAVILFPNAEMFAQYFKENTKEKRFMGFKEKYSPKQFIKRRCNDCWDYNGKYIRRKDYGIIRVKEITIKQLPKRLWKQLSNIEYIQLKGQEL